MRNNLNASREHAALLGASPPAAGRPGVMRLTHVLLCVFSPRTPPRPRQCATHGVRVQPSRRRVTLLPAFAAQPDAAACPAAGCKCRVAALRSCCGSADTCTAPPHSWTTSSARRRRCASCCIPRAPMATLTLAAAPPAPPLQSLASLAGQRSMFMDMSTKLGNLGAKFPVVNSLVSAIRRKKSKDTLILSAVVACCTLFLLAYWSRK